METVKDPLASRSHISLVQVPRVASQVHLLLRAEAEPELPMWITTWRLAGSGGRRCLEGLGKVGIRGKGAREAGITLYHKCGSLGHTEQVETVRLLPIWHKPGEVLAGIFLEGYGPWPQPILS